MSFARFENMTACKTEMTGLGHTDKDAVHICTDIQERAEKGILYKAETVGLEILSKAGESDIVVGGNASWDIEDLDGDIFTVEAQVKALNRFFSQPPEYQDVTVNHGKGLAQDFKLAQPLLKYTDSQGKEYFSHVHEKGTFLISKLRNDSLKATRIYRQKALNGELDGYSVTAMPLTRDSKNPKKVLDLEYHAITITEKGIMAPRNPMTKNVVVISKSEAIEEALKQKIIALNKATPEREFTLEVEHILQKHGFNKVK